MDSPPRVLGLEEIVIIVAGHAEVLAHPVVSVPVHPPALITRQCDVPTPPRQALFHQTNGAVRGRIPMYGKVTPYVRGHEYVVRQRTGACDTLPV